MRHMVLMFRGEEREIEYKDHGADHETNSHDVDWHFCAGGFPCKGPRLTDKEEQDIYEAILKHADDLRSSEEEPSYYDK